MTEDDFDVVLPSEPDEEQLQDGADYQAPPHSVISPWTYHVLLSQAALISHRFNRALKKNPDALEELVRKTDDDLANIIDHLPYHLQPDSERTTELEEAENKYPWIKWQRLDLTTLLLQCRFRVNYQCRLKWSEARSRGHPSHSICLEAARLLIVISARTDLPVHQRRYW